MSRRGMRDWAFCALASVKGLLKRACLSVSLSVCAVKLLYIENELIQRWMIDSRTNTVSRATKFHSHPSVTTQAYYDQKIEGHSMSLCNNLLQFWQPEAAPLFSPANKVWVCQSMTPKVPLLSGEGDSGGFRAPSTWFLGPSVHAPNGISIRSAVLKIFISPE